MSVFKISASKNLDFINSIDEWRKWRVAYEGGRLFTDRFLSKFSKREDEDDFKERKQMAYNPAFAEAGINDFKNSIYQRMNDIKRIGGSNAYQAAIKGKDGGVDGYGCSMNTFMGQKVLPELLPIGKVGIMVDKAPVTGPYKQVKKNNPYLYYYCAEDIWNWAYIMGDDGEQIFYNLLLRITEYGYDDKTGLPLGTKDYIRHFWLRDDGKVAVTDYTETPDIKGVVQPDIVAREPVILDIPRIPFVLMSLTSGLMKNIANYQIGLLNLNSSDLNYLLKGNIPFYTEQYNAAVENVYRKPDGKDTGTAVASKASGNQEAGVGTVSGRRYPMGAERPGFIAPPAEPLIASMKKQDQMKEDIRNLLNLGVANTKSTHASADSKGMDDRSMEAGLSSIGQELEWGEREIAKIWAMYESSDPAEINYPVKYELKSQKDREDSAKSLKELKNAVPSKTFGKEIGKRIGRVMLEGTVDDAVLTKIDNEIDAANYITSDAVEITADITNGLVSPETASTARGYDGAKEVPLAQEAQAKRLAIIATSQAAGQGAGAAKGIPDATAAPGAAKDQKTISQNQDTNPGSKTRGPGK